MSAIADRRAARASWIIEIQRSPKDDEDDDEALYWLQVPPEDRARLTWELSRELYELAAKNGGVFDEDTGTFTLAEENDLERRLPRAALRIARR